MISASSGKALLVCAVRSTSSTQTRRRAPEEVSYALSRRPLSHSRHEVSRAFGTCLCFPWLVSKDLAAFQKAKQEVGGASERASKHPALPAAAAPDGDPPPAPIRRCPAAFPPPAQPRAASSSAAAVSPQEDWAGGPLSLQRPRPLVFLLSRLWDLLPSPERFLSRAALSEETRAQASAAAREPSWAQDIPSRFRSSPPRLGCNEGERSSPVSHACLLTRERTKDPRLESLLAEPRDGPVPKLRKERGWITTFLAPSRTPERRRARLTKSRFP